jgi:predicted nucleic acid-binding protein
MPERLVMDASVALAILLDEPTAADAARLLAASAEGDGAVIVPDHFWLELGNVLVRRYGWDADAVVAAFRELDELGVVTMALDRPLVLLCLDLLARHGLTAYDTAYLALAEVEDAGLLSLDTRLVIAAGERAVIPGGSRTREARTPYGLPSKPPAWAAHGRYLAELRRIAGAVSGA